MKEADRPGLTLDAIEDYETCEWLNEQLDRLEQLVRDNGEDDEMLEAISFLREENNEWWTPSDVEQMARSGQLRMAETSSRTN